MNITGGSIIGRQKSGTLLPNHDQQLVLDAVSQIDPSIKCLVPQAIDTL